MCRCGGASEHNHITTFSTTKSLHSFIVMERSSVLNAKNPNLLHSTVLREKFLESVDGERMRSECDDQLLINITFSGTVKVKSIEIFGGGNVLKTPTKMKVYVNSPNVDFTNVDNLPIAQEFNIASETDLTNNRFPSSFPTRAAKFFNVNNLTLLLEGNRDREWIEINYLGFEGEFSQSRVGAVKAEYEIKPLISDHSKLETSIHTFNQ